MSSSPLAIAAIAVLIAAGCGASSPAESGDEQVVPPGRAEQDAVDAVPCGEQSCGPREYCLVECLCCGTPIADPSEASARYRCLPVPDGCDPEDLCGCEGRHQGLCTPDRRTVETPCA